MRLIPGPITKKLLQLIHDSGIEFNEQFEVTVDGVRFPTSNLMKILEHIINVEEREEYDPPFGYYEVVSHLLASDLDIPDAILPYLEVREEDLEPPETPVSELPGTASTLPRSAHVGIRRRKSMGVMKQLDKVWKTIDNA